MGLSRIPATEKRNKLVEIYSDIVPSIASSVARRLPPSFDRDDLEQTGMLAILEAEPAVEDFLRSKVEEGARLALVEAAPAVESYLRTRVHGAIQDTARGIRYRDATHLDLEAAAGTPDQAGTPLESVLRDETRQIVNKSVKSLVRSQRRALRVEFGNVEGLPRQELRAAHENVCEKDRRRGKPRNSYYTEKAKAIEGLRNVLAKAA